MCLIKRRGRWKAVGSLHLPRLLIKPFFLQTGDREHWLAARAETSAYHLNKGEPNTALAISLEIDQLRKEAGAIESTDHTLLMPGVVYRHKKGHERARRYLQQLLACAEGQQNQNAAATVEHHLGWRISAKRKHRLLPRLKCY